MRNRIVKRRMKKKTKKESSKKKRNHFSRHRKTLKMHVKRCPTKKGNRQNRAVWEQKKTEKTEFCRSLQGYKKL